MDLTPYKIKLRRNKAKSNGSHQYSLTYKRSKEHINQASYDILSALAGDSDLMIEFNSDLFTGVSSEPNQCADQFLKDIQSLNLEHGSREAPSNSLVRFFGMTMERRDKKQVHQVVAYVPNRIWKKALFKDVLPVCGARYYITREPMDAKTAVDQLFSLSEEQKAATFSLTLFNMAEYSRFGIVSAIDSEKELRGLLGLR